ncbi:RNA 3'-terminal phosphate cyclase [Desulfosediminicola ganghwensis]|uniref:RNA 3'-terminal phosphate cyclase n=1 Tax=Desulfosediminicola ganghwensis TaxID=2569540 RepID=UPI0010AD3DD9|nr:RNA 3'-terminal phosphate cyclase [Desulfosediminicola ganghwensis]
MIEIDGAYGEGGGQIVRSALGLSLVTGRSFTIRNIRAKRKKPGLLRQHLTAVRAAAQISSAQVQGAALGSETLYFEPGAVQAGSYLFQVGTAGSCTLVLQAILPGLLAGSHPCRVTIEGGTHNPMAPPFEFLQQSYLPLLNRMGVEIRARLVRPGFFPVGGGRIEVEIIPARSLTPLELVTRGEVSLSARSYCAQLPEHIGRRELRVVCGTLHIDRANTKHIQDERYGPGNVLSVFVHSDQLTETFTGFGEKHLSAEKVAQRTVSQVKRYLKSGAPVGPNLADQLLLPMALAGTGHVRTLQPTNHTLTNIAVIETFLATRFVVSQVSHACWDIAL